MIVYSLFLNHPIQGNQGNHVIYIIYKYSTLIEWGDRQLL